jgi:hypothetical protein
MTQPILIDIYSTVIVWQSVVNRSYVHLADVEPIAAQLILAEVEQISAKLNLAGVEPITAQLILADVGPVTI